MSRVFTGHRLVNHRLFLVEPVVMGAAALFLLVSAFVTPLPDSVKINHTFTTTQLSIKVHDSMMIEISYE